MKRYKNTSIIKDTKTNDRYLATTIYDNIEPTENDEYIITKKGDRLDQLANKYYNDITKWYDIAIANNINTGSMILTGGLQIRIP